MATPEDKERIRQAIGGISAKLLRAETHLQTLDAEWGNYIGADPSPYDFIVHEYPDSGDYVIYAEIVKPPPTELSVIVGDILHNLRSGLDHLAWEIVKRAGGKPGRHTCFPICDSEAEWRNKVERRRRTNDPPNPLHGIEPGTPYWEFIQAVQPYKGAVYANAMTSLRILSNADKHRSLLVSGIYPDPDDFAALLRWSPEAVLRSQQILLKPDKPLKNGDEIAALNFDPRKPDPDLQVEGELGFDVGFSDGRWDSDRPAIADLKAALFQYVEYAAALFMDPPHFEDPAQLADLMGSAFE